MGLLSPRQKICSRKKGGKKENACTYSFFIQTKKTVRRTKMDASDVLLAQWEQQVKEIWKHWHVYRQESLAIAVLGIVLAGNAVMQRVAEALYDCLSDPCKMSSYERRLQRLIDNEDICVKEGWETFLAHTLPFWTNRKATLVLDCTPYNQEFTIVFVGILVQKRLLPVAWEIMPQTETWEEGQWQIVERLFEQVAQFLPASHVTVLADRGLTALALIRLCERHHWHYVLRLKQEEYCRRQWRSFYRDWQTSRTFVLKKGTSWYGKVLVWKEHGFACTLSACWDEAFEEAWLLISDLPASPRLVSIYGMRMRVEATFQDTKSRRWCRESSQLREKDHLHRWLMILFLAFWWTTHLGASCKHHGHAKAFDRTDRYDKSLLRLGHLWIKELIKRANKGMRQQSVVEAPRLANCLPFHHTKVGLRFSICSS
jgi:Transposase DDE domain